MPVSARSHGRQAGSPAGPLFSALLPPSSDWRLAPEQALLCIFYEEGRAGQPPKGGSTLRAENIEGKGVSMGIPKRVLTFQGKHKSRGYGLKEDNLGDLPTPLCLWCLPQH